MRRLDELAFFGIIHGMFSLIATSLIAPVFFEFAPEVRSAYQSLGKIIEDHPMQVTFARVGVDTGTFGKFGIRNWDVSSLSDRRADIHRHALYHTELGVSWQYDLELPWNWRLKTDLAIASWTFYRGFEDADSNKDYRWHQIDQSLENPYIVPFYRLRRCVEGSDYLYFKAGFRRRFNFFEDYYLTPSVYVEGGNSRNHRRVLGKNVTGDDWGYGGVSSINFRLEGGWRICGNVTAFVFVDQYEIVGSDARDSIAASTNKCVHNDLTIAGIGFRMNF